MDGDTPHRLRSRLHEIDWRRMLFEYPPLPLPNVAFRNRGDLTFEDASRAWRFDLGDDISHGMAAADLDGDGDLDGHQPAGEARSRAPKRCHRTAHRRSASRHPAEHLRHREPRAGARRGRT